MFVRERLIEGDEQGFGVVDGGGEERGADDLVEFGEGEWGEFGGVVVIESQQSFGGGVEWLDEWGGHGRQVVETEKRRRKTGFYHRGHRVHGGRRRRRRDRDDNHARRIEVFRKTINAERRGGDAEDAEKRHQRPVISNQ